MNDGKMGVLQFIGAHGSTDALPKRAGVVPKDRYLLDLLIRHFQACRPGMRTRVVNWSKASDGALRAEIEEVSLLGPKPFYVVLGPPKGWAKTLAPALGTFLIAEDAGGILEGEEFFWRNRRMVLRALVKVLALPWTDADLERLDWSWCQRWADFEPLLVRGKVLGWNLSRLMREAERRTRASVFALARSGRWDDVRFLADRYGRAWLYRHLMEFSVLVARYHDLSARRPRGRKIEEKAIARRLGVPPWQFEQVRDAASDTSPEQVLAFARRVVRLDALCQRNIEAGLDILLMGADL